MAVKISIPAGDLARVPCLEANDDWPDTIEVRATWKTAKGGRRFRSLEVSGDQFFGRAGYNAPMSGEVLIGMIDRLRRAGPR